ncbi:MAG: hypothetical protein BWY59_01221 [Verrucomicrobia bacterium ADurb.Bin345]|nr:MAG: hypothetical protein BWY59_01221 [Verrucomicrobia bacterium ADurb.Bin345]
MNRFVLIALVSILAVSGVCAQTPASQATDNLPVTAAIGGGVIVDAENLSFGVLGSSNADGQDTGHYYYVSPAISVSWIGPATDENGLPDLWRVVVYNDNDVNGNGENAWGLENPKGGQLPVKFTSLAKGNTQNTATLKANVATEWNNIESLPAGFQTWSTLAGWWNGERTYNTHFVVQVPKTGAASGIYRTTAIFDLVFNVP